MIRLDATTKKLQIKLVQAVTTNQLQVVSSFSDKTTSSYAGNTQFVNTNNTTLVDIVNAPAASTIRDVDSINVYNLDTVKSEVILSYDNNGTEYVIFSTILLPNETLQYTHGSGWQVYDVFGNLKITDEALIGPNVLDNSCCRISQLGTSFTASTTFKPNDGNITLDRFVFLKDSSAVVEVYQIRNGSTNTRSMAVQMTTSGKFGVVQLLTNAQTIQITKPTADATNGICSLSFEALGNSAQLNNVTLLLLGWSGTVDAPTKDVVGTWNANGTLPTPATGWTILASEQYSLDAIRFNRFKLEGVNVEDLYHNLAYMVLFNNPGTVTGTERVDMSQFKLEIGAKATPYRYKDFRIELANCQHYMFVLGGTTNRLPATGVVHTTSTVFWSYNVPPMRVDPALTLAGTGNFYLNDRSVQANVTVSANYSSKFNIAANFAQGGTTFTLDRSTFAGFTDTTTYLVADANLGV